MIESGQVGLGGDVGWFGSEQLAVQLARSTMTVTTSFDDGVEQERTGGLYVSLKLYREFTVTYDDWSSQKTACLENRQLK